MASDRPNIIFIITDQQRFDTIGALGFDHMDTPNLDRLVREGVAFTRSYVAGASCVPSRASLFSGYYPHTTGILKNADTWRRSWVENLAAVGYHTVNVGKMHTWPFTTPLGFKERYVVENKDRYLEGRWFFDEWDKALKARGIVKQQRELYRKRPDYRTSLGAFPWELDEDMQADMFVGDFAVWWLTHHPKKEPLFLEVGFPGPHPPYDPLPRYAEAYLKKDLPLLDVTEEELEAQPGALKDLRLHNTEVDHDSLVHLPNPTREQRHRQRAYYLANVSMIDSKIGAILEALKSTGYLDNAVLVFTSDHGDCMTDHGHSQKWTMYDSVTRTPLIVWAPGRFRGGKTVDSQVQQMDVAPALLELAGAAMPEGMEAVSMLPLLQGEEAAIRDTVYAEQGKDDHLRTCDFMTMIRTEEWKLVHFLDQQDGQLFDVKRDPDEVRNLWTSAEHREIRRELMETLSSWRIRSGFATRARAADWR